MQLGAPSIYSEEVLKKYTSPVRPKRNAADGWTAKLRADVAGLGIKGKEFHSVFNASLRRRVVVHDPPRGAWTDTDRELATIFEDAPWFDDAEPDSDSDSAPDPTRTPPPPPLVLYGRVETFTDCPRIVEKYVVDKRKEGTGGLQVSPEFIKERTETRLAYAACLCRNPWLGEVDFEPIMPTLYEQTADSNPRTVDSLASPKFRSLYRPPNRCETRGTLHDVNHGLGKTPRASDHSEEDLWTAYAYHLTKLPLDVHWMITRDDRKRLGRCRIYTKHAFIDALRALRTPTTPGAGKATNKNEVSILFSVGTGHAQFLTAGEVSLRTLCSSSAVLCDPAKWRVSNAPPGVLDADQDAVELGCAEDDPLYPVAAQLQSVPHAFSAVPCLASEFGVAPVGFWDSPVEYIMVGRDGRIRGREVVDRIGIVGTAFGKTGLFASPELEKMATSADLPSFTTTLRDKSAVARTVTARRGGIDPALFENSAEVAERVVKSATVLPLVLRGTGKFGGLDFSRTLPRKPPTKRSASTSDSDANTVQLVPNIIGPMVDPGRASPSGSGRTSRSAARSGTAPPFCSPTLFATWRRRARFSTLGKRRNSHTSKMIPLSLSEKPTSSWPSMPEPASFPATGGWHSASTKRCRLSLTQTPTGTSKTRWGRSCSGSRPRKSTPPARHWPRPTRLATPASGCRRPTWTAVLGLPTSARSRRPSSTDGSTAPSPSGSGAPSLRRQNRSSPEARSGSPLALRLFFSKRQKRPRSSRRFSRRRPAPPRAH